MNKDLHILIIAPSSGLSAPVERQMKKLGFDNLTRLSPDAPGEEFYKCAFDLAILCAGPDPEKYLSLLRRLKIMNALLPVLVLSAKDLAGDGAALWGYECLHFFKGIPDRDALAKALETAWAGRETVLVESDLPILVGKHDQMNSVRQTIERVSDKDITVLITGETGTGKELIARLIHGHSERRKGPLVKVNCGALPDDLLESEMFGFQKGAFTGAYKDKPGRFELAGGGTLFVDEIGDLSFSLQAKFLQVLEDKAFSRLGDTDEKAVDARVVAATNSNLWKKVQEGTFRKDLFYRLNVVHIHAPALRERPEDVPPLVEYFLQRYSAVLRRNPIALPDKVVAFLKTYPWPGNVRELENVVRRAIAMRDWRFAFEELKQADPPEEEATHLKEGACSVTSMEGGIEELLRRCDFSLKDATKAFVYEIEKEAILKALNETRWNRKKAARILKVSYRTLLSRLEEMELEG